MRGREGGGGEGGFSTGLAGAHVLWHDMTETWMIGEPMPVDLPAKFVAGMGL